MKRLILLALFLSMASVAAGEVSVRVCLADGNTPFLPIDPNFPHVYPDIMVGTKLTIIIDSNVAEYWIGSFAIADANMDYGVLSARGYDGFGYPGSCFPAAGEGAAVYAWTESGIDGFDLYTGFSGIEVDDWFIIDYTATSIGECKVEFYEWLVHDPNRDLSFTHVRTRDFNKDTKVDFTDFAMLASYWQGPNCNDPNWCEGTDLNTIGGVDTYDLALFVDYWLEKTE